MAEVQVSEPLVGENFTDRGWRAAHAGRTGILDDFDGSAFGLTLPAEGNTIEIGSATQPSQLVVDGFGLEIPRATTESLSVPASSSGGTTGRTDLIVARYSTAFTTDPGPVRVHRIPGTEGSLAVPNATYDPVGIRDTLLYAIRRRQGEGLNQAIVTDMRTRIGDNFDVPNGGLLPVNAPLASRASRGSAIYRRDVVGTDVDWVEEWVVPNASGATVFDTGWVLLTPLDGWERVSSRPASVRRVGTKVEFRGALQTVSGNPPSGDHIPAQVPGGIGCRPTAMSRWSSMTFSDRTTVRVVLGTDGLITFVNLVGSGATLQVDSCGFTTD